MKVGDKVRVIGTAPFGKKTGRIMEIRAERDYLIYVDIPESRVGWCVYTEDELELLPDSLWDRPSNGNLIVTVRDDYKVVLCRVNEGSTGREYAKALLAHPGNKWRPESVTLTEMWSE